MIDGLGACLHVAVTEGALVRPLQLILGRLVTSLIEEFFLLLGRLDHIVWHGAERDEEVLEQLIFVFGWENGRANNHLVENAAEAPHVDGVVVLDAQHDFRRSIVTTLHIEEAGRAVSAAGTEVNDLHSVVRCVSEQDVLRLYIAMNDAFVAHELEAGAHLPRDTLELSLTESALVELVHLLVRVKVGAEALKHNDHVLAEQEVVDHVYEASAALVIVVVWLAQLLQDVDLDVRIVHVELLVLAQLEGHQCTLCFRAVHALNDLTEGSLVNELHDLVAIADLLAYLELVLAVLVADRILIESAHATQRVNTLVHV